MMTALVTGGGGRLGRVISTALKALPNLKTQSAKHAECDLTDLSCLREYVRQCDPDVIVNCAAYTDVDGCEEDPSLAFACNAAGAGNLARVASELGARLVHISTDYVFDGAKSTPYVESDAACPLNAYGRSKLLGEQYVRELLSRHLILRTSWLYGAFERGFIQTILEMAKQQEHLSVVADTFGTPTYAGDLARQVVALLDAELNGTFHCSSQGACTRFEWALLALQLNGFERAGGDEKGIWLLGPGPRRRRIFLAAVGSMSIESRSAPRPLYSVLDNYGLRAQGLDVMPEWAVSFRACFRELTKRMTTAA